ncbi:MAG TPA: alpha/beta fold hydrolase, partial [Ktedonobacteraceae bacterium]|nr:alpha/beta fold hydrolase [Ktedonobacteraceae bacterium]
MALDVELYRRTVYVPTGPGAKRPLRRLSVIDIHPEGATRTLVFVHGYGGSVLQWLYQLRFFGQTMRVIAPELRGHGHSDDPSSLPLTMESLVDDLETVLAAMEVQRPFSLIAHSFGGAVSTEYALRHPQDVSELILIGVPTRFIVRPILRKLMHIPDPLFSGVAKRIRVALFASQRTLTRMHDRVMAPWRGDERLQLLHVPTLVVLGQRDTVFLRQHYDEVPRSIPGSHNVVIPVSAHLVQLERPDAVNRAIRRFIEPRAQQKSGISFVSDAHIGEHGYEESAARRQSASGSLLAEGRVALATRIAEMPWLQHYDQEVPEQLPLPKQLLHELLSNAAQDLPHHPALLFFGQKISYRELDSLSNRFAHALRKLGINRGERVAVLLPNIPQCVIAFYGTLKAGGVLVLGSPLSNEEEIAYQMRNSGAKVLLTLDSYRDRVERFCIDTDIQQIIYTDVREYLPIRQRVLLASLIEGSTQHPEVTMPQGNGAVPAPVGTLPLPLKRAGTSSRKHYSFQHLLRSQPALLLDSGTSSGDLALLQYTSGTTDSPKGVMLTHCNLMVNVSQVRHWMPDAKRGQEVILSVLPLSHSYGVTDCLNLPIAIAGSSVLLPTARIDEILHAIKRYHPSIFPGIPSLYLAIANYPRVRSYGVGSIRTCVSGSAPLPVEVQEAFEKLT